MTSVPKTWCTEFGAQCTETVHLAYVTLLGSNTVHIALSFGKECCSQLIVGRNEKKSLHGRLRISMQKLRFPSSPKAKFI